MDPRWPSRREKAALLIGGVLFGALGFAPLMAGPGYEAALATGVLAPPLVAAATASELATRRREPVDAYFRGVHNGVAVALLAYALALAHGVRVGLCDVAGGSVLFALGPGIGSMLAGVWGALAGELAGRMRGRRGLRGALLGVAGPLGSAGVQLAIFYATPMVFAYDPFAGYFSGALYDTVLSYGPLYTYRAASAGTLFGTYVIALHLRRAGPGLRWRSLGRPGLVGTGVLALAASALSVTEGPALDHWQTADTLETTLRGRIEVGRCDVVFARRGVTAARAALLARECDAQVRSLEEWIGASEGGSIRVYLFDGRAQQRRLMGAGQVAVAKPWRREVYLQVRDYPHPVLRHELAHALLGAHGRGPFDIAGALGGWLPDPGLIEGAAVAAAPPDDTLSVHEWAAAMRAIDALPSVRTLFGLSFFGQASSASYTAAGSFVDLVRADHGAEVVRAWYGGRDVTELTARSWEELEAAWHARLDAVVLSEAALSQARERFDRPGVIHRRCPHVVDELLVEADALHGGGDHALALQRYEEVRALDEGNVPAMLGGATCHDRLGRPDLADEVLARVAADARLTRAARGEAEERRGDLALRAGQIGAARTQYAAVRQTTVSEDRLRTLDVKETHAADEVARAAVLALLVGTTHEGPSNVEALDRIGVWRAKAGRDGTPEYLLARQHLGGERYRLAAERLDAALARGLEAPRVHDETLRLRIVAACALGDGDAATAALARYAARDGVAPNRKRYWRAVVDRCLTHAE